MLPPLKVGPWRLSELPPPAEDAPKVFSCFHCGGGSSMGYKLAGYRVLGGVEIDPKMMAMYRKNHQPKHSFLMGVQDFNRLPDEKIPNELFNLDVLDGSPPCSSFSMAGSREKAWGEKKKFREGQAEQVLDDLFFHFIEIAKRLQPKVVIAENVKGLLMGAARGYVKEIFRGFREAGYECQLFLLNSSRMGVPQARERTFFVARRTDLNLPPMRIAFGERPATFGEAIKGIDHVGKPLTEKTAAYWRATPPGKTLAHAHENGSMFTWTKLSADRPANTQTSGPAQLCHNSPNHISGMASVRIQSFPDDYNFDGNEPRYVCGMSVPPFMMQRVADQVRRQWLSPDGSATPFASDQSPISEESEAPEPAIADGSDGPA